MKEAESTLPKYTIFNTIRLDADMYFWQLCYLFGIQLV